MKQREKMHKKFLGIGYMEEEARRMASELHYPPYSWQYNQIVGYIQVSINRCEVYFDVFSSPSKNYRISSKMKNCIIRQINANHIYVGNKTDRNIKVAILETLEHIEKIHLKSKFFVDYSTFNNLIEYVNIKKIMDDFVP